MTRILETAPDGIVCEGRLPAGGPYERDGRCPTFVLIEVAAQAAAALAALSPRSASDGAGRAEYLVRARDIHCARPEFDSGQVLRARVRRAGDATPLHLFEVEVRGDAAILLRGEIGIYIDEG